MSRVLLAFLLAALGALLSRASRRSAGFRAALSRDRTVAIETRDGVAHHFSVKKRCLYAGRGAVADADFKLSFATSGEALRMLFTRNGLERMLDGMSRGAISVDGDLLLFMWFQGRLEEAAPFAAARRRVDRFPGAYTQPRSDIKAAHMIRREPVEEALDPDWAAAWRAREKLLMMRVAAGEPAPRF